MQRRVKRFKLKKDRTNEMSLSLQTSKHGDIQVSLHNISILSIGVIIDKKFLDLVDTTATALIQLDNETIDIGKVYVLKELEQPMGDDDEASTILILRALEKNIPVEKVMRFIDNQGSTSPYSFELNHGPFTIADFYSYHGSDDILEKTNLFLTMHNSWKKKSVYQFECYRKPSKGVRINLDRKRDNGSREFLIFGSNDYLGLAADPRVVEAAKNALDKYGFGSTGSPLTTGLSDEHAKLQNLLTGLFERESCLLFNSGYAANIGILGSICRKNDLVLFDKLSHASIQDGLRMATASGAKCIPFGHNDMNHLEQLLKENRQSHSGCLLVTEGVFSMDGDIANLGPFVELAHRFNARTYLDVAHDFGVIGTHGLGAAELHGVLNDIDIIMGTFSKIGGGIGGFCVGSEGTIEYLRWMARSFMFSVSIPPSTAAAMHQAIQIFRNEPHLLAKLQENIAYFVGELIKIGVPFSQDHQSSICPVIIGDEEKLSQMTAFLMQNGIYVTPIVFPAVSKEQSRFRFTISAAHSRTDLDYAVLVLKLAIKEFGLNFTAPNNQLRLVG